MTTSYKNKASATKAAKRQGFENFAVVPHADDAERFAIVDTTKASARAEKCTGNPIPTAWRFFDENVSNMSRPEMNKALIKAGLNANMVRSQSYRFHKWLKNEWVRPVTCPVAA